MEDLTIAFEPVVLLTDKIRMWAMTVLDEDIVSESAKQELRNALTPDTENNTIPFRLVLFIKNNLSAESGKLYLHELLEGSDIVLPEYKPPPRNPKLEARVQQLKAQQENAAYKQMTQNVGFSRDDSTSIGQDFGKEVKNLNQHIMAVINFILTILGAFAFGYKAMEYSLEEANISAQLCSGLIVATVVFFADLYFLIKYNV